MSRNLLKGSYVKDNGQRIIDYNDLISNRIENLKKQAEEGSMNAGFVSGISAQAVESLIGPDMEETAATVDGLEQLLTNVSQPEETPELKELADNVLAQAHEKAEALLAEAQQNAEAMMADARQQGMDAGYQEGYEKGYAEGRQKGEDEYSSRVRALSEEKIKLNAEFDKKYAQIEPQIVNTVLDVIEKVTGIVYENNRDILIHLINRVLNDIEPSSEYLIKVSHEDYEFVLGKQARIYAASVKDMNIDILEDGSLAAGQCLIETDGGIFDCSLDVQMEQLVNDIRLLAGV